MTQIGLNVPPGFVITTDACLEYLNSSDKKLPERLMEEVRRHIRQVEKASGKRFGDANNPLLVSVRSGSALSMPGMMDTILNLGLNRETLKGLIRRSGNKRFGYDAYRRFIQLFGKVALGVPDEKFDEHFEEVKQRAGVKADIGLSAEDLLDISERFLQVVHETLGMPFPEDAYEQLEIAIKAVFNSWMGKRAIDYRREFRITPEMANGTAVNVVTMVFGNMGNDCATGVGFTRDPGTGESKRDTLTADTVTGLAFMFSYAPQSAALLPLVIDEADHGRYGPLMSLAQLMTQSVGGQMSRGMQWSVVCAEDADRSSDDASAADTVLGAQVARMFFAACPAWPTGKRPADFTVPLKSTVPALLLSGELDPVTPPRYGERVLAGLGNGRHQVLRGQGHNVSGIGCMPKLLGQFFETADAKALDMRCLDTLTYVPPFTSFNGWEP